MKLNTLKVVTGLSLYLLVANNASAVKVYHCVNADNEVSFSGTPCEKDATLVRELDIDANSNVIGLGSTAPAPAENTPDGNNTETSPTDNSSAGSAIGSSSTGSIGSGTGGGGGGAGAGGGSGATAAATATAAPAVEGDGTASTATDAVSPDDGGTASTATDATAADDSGVVSTVTTTSVPSSDSSGRSSAASTSLTNSAVTTTNAPSSGGDLSSAAKKPKPLTNSAVTTTSTSTTTDSGTATTTTTTTTTDTPVAEAPAPTAEEPAPVADAPVADAPVADAPVADAPVADAPVADAPLADAPVADAPLADAPVADAPLADAPLADAPVADAPVADAPVADTPIPETPIAETYTITGLTQDPNTSYIAEKIIVDLSKQEITIDGQLFGTRPNIIVYDTFEGGVTGEQVAITNPKNQLCSTEPYLPDLKDQPGPTLGCWDAYSNSDLHLPKYYADGHSGTSSMLGYNHDTQGGAKLRKYFESGITEIFLSYWVRIPPGMTFPGIGAEPSQFPPGSSWKFTWLNGGTTTSDGVGDICIPTYTGSNIFQIAGNDSNIFRIGYNTWWSWNNWLRISVWIRANTEDPLLAGDALFQAVSADRGFYQEYKSTPIFDADGPFPKLFTEIGIPGWMRSNSDPRTNPLYDDIYIATGVNSIARVEIGDAPTYADSTNLEIQLPIEWTDSRIKVSINNTGFPQGITSNYLYITDSNGNVNQTGYLLNNQ